MRIYDLIEDEIRIHSEVKEPFWWECICMLAGRSTCHEAVVLELKMLLKNRRVHAAESVAEILSLSQLEFPPTP
jgi:hypothetical protein